MPGNINLFTLQYNKQLNLSNIKFKFIILILFLFNFLTIKSEINFQNLETILKFEIEKNHFQSIVIFLGSNITTTTLTNNKNNFKFKKEILNNDFIEINEFIYRLHSIYSIPVIFITNNCKEYYKYNLNDENFQNEMEQGIGRKNLFNETIIKNTQKKVTTAANVTITNELLINSLKIGDFTNLNIISIVIFKNLNDNIFNIVDNLLIDNHISKMIFIIDSPMLMNYNNNYNNNNNNKSYNINDNQNIKMNNNRLILKWQFFRWCWKRRIINVILIENFCNKASSDCFNIYGYLPFPRIRLINLNLQDKNNFFPNKLKDVQKYQFRSSIHERMPQIFYYTNIEGEKVIGGFQTNIYFHFLESINASFQQNPYINGQNLFNEISFLFTWNSSVYYRQKIVKTWIYDMTSWCIMIPIVYDIDYSLYFTLPFQKSVWLLLLASIFYLTIIEIIQQKFAFNSINYGIAFLNSICTILYLPTKFQKSSKIQIYFIKAINVTLGLIISMLYLCSLSSYLTKEIRPHQINSWKELEKSNLKIMSYDAEINSILERTAFPENCAHKLYPVNENEFLKQRFNMNDKYGYTVTKRTASILLLWNQDITKPKFRLTDICFSQISYTFPAIRDSPFLDSFKFFVMRMQEIGLYFFWYKRANLEVHLHDDYKNVTFSRYKRNSRGLLKFQHFKIAILIWRTGILISFICFIGELLIKKKFNIYSKIKMNVQKRYQLYIEKRKENKKSTPITNVREYSESIDLDIEFKCITNLEARKKSLLNLT